MALGQTQLCNRAQLAQLGLARRHKKTKLCKLCNRAQLAKTKLQAKLCKLCKLCLTLYSDDDREEGTL